MQAKTPVAVFTYNRPEHTRNMLQSLADCARLEECDVFIYSDGPRISEHIQKVEEVRAVIRAWSIQHGARIVERNQNFGLARSIVIGVTELCELYGCIIVVEDDLVLHPAFLHYMLSALQRYENEDRVAQVAGYMFPIMPQPLPETFFLPFTSSWGWATWQRVWKTCDWEAKDSISILSEPGLRSQFDLDDSYPFSKMLEDQLAGKNQSWAILFYLSVFKNKKQILYPARSLVKNFGFDGSGFHYSRQSLRLPDLMEPPVFFNRQILQPFVFPDIIATESQNLMRIKEYFYNTIFRTPSLYKRIIRKIKMILGLNKY